MATKLLHPKMKRCTNIKVGIDIVTDIGISVISVHWQKRLADILVSVSVLISVLISVISVKLVSY